MSKQCYVPKVFNVDAMVLIGKCNIIVEHYAGQGLRLTLRQLYYQLVAHHGLPNIIQSYKKLGKIVSDARLAGLLSWNGIEDRIRMPSAPSQFRDLAHLTDAASRAYRLDRWQGQDNYVELWVEKDALAGVLEPIAREYHVTLMVNRGYSSTSAMYDSAQRFIANRFTTIHENDADSKSILVDSRRPGEKIRDMHLLYLGDHDPSGEDMVRDVGDRLRMFGARVYVKKIALTMEQIDQYNPPPNPAKITDSRAAKYIEQHGDSSWELDAIPPEELEIIIRQELGELVDKDRVEEVISRENVDKKRLRVAVSKLVKEKRS